MPSVKINEKLLNWATDYDQNTLNQALKTARLPFVPNHVALMPDAHVGIGATVGSVIPTQGAIVPSCVGVDIGCGMIGVETSLFASDLPSLSNYMPRAKRDVPAGVGVGHEIVTKRVNKWFEQNSPPSELSSKQMKRAMEQFGSMGGGNHFYEVCLDERGVVWLVLHSGSRGIGNELAQIHIDKAKLLCREAHIGLEDPDLAYFVQGTPEFNAYIADMLWCQRYARANRDAMVDAALLGFFAYVGRGTELNRINCHHNFCQQETHYGKNVWITRKGAIKAGVNDYGIIPGDMGARTYIVKGKGNKESYESCSHGAGRRMSRNIAKKLINVDEFKDHMNSLGIVWQEDEAIHLIDEAHGAYKDIDAVMAAQEDLVEVQHTLHQIFNMKGAEKRRR